MLWYHVDRLERLLKLLGPMAEMSPGILTFVQYHIPSDRWERFFFYANRVRQLECTESYPEIHHRSFATLSISRPVLHVLPNVTHLTWKKDPARPSASLTLCLMFLTPNLKSLSVRTGLGSIQADLFAIDNFFRNVVVRSPLIEHIDFRSEIPFHNIGPVLSKFLSSLSHLKSVRLSDSLLSSDLVTALAKCPDLEAIRIADPEEPTNRGQELADLENFMPVLRDGAFPSIKIMQFKAHLWNATRFLQSLFPASRLQSLAIRTLRYEPHENIGGLFSVVAEACPGIQDLELSIDFAVENEENEPIPFAVLEPLLQCGSLVQFTICAPSPLDLDDAGAALLASHWPKMQVLNLNSSPLPRHPERIRLTFTALNSFATHCPSLRHLGICVRPLVPPLKARTPLRKLVTFTFSVSDYGFDFEELALFLTDVLPSKCRIVGKAVYPMLADVNLTVHSHFARSQLLLEKTLGLLDMLRRVHGKYSERLRALEEEVLRLKVESTAK